MRPGNSPLSWTASIALLLITTVLVGCGGSPYLRYADPYRPYMGKGEYEEAKKEVEAASEAMPAVGRDLVYRVAANDLLDIRVFGQPDMSMSARVGGEGTINFPPLGEVQVEGLTPRQLEARLENELEGDYLTEPHVTVMVQEAESRQVTVVGAVQKPGRYTLWGPQGVFDMISQAGGLEDNAGYVGYVLRPVGVSAEPSTNTQSLLEYMPHGSEERSSAREAIKIYLNGFLLHGEKVWNLPLQPGDIVTVPPAGFVHISGRGIEKAGTYPLERYPKTMRQIIDEAEGLRPHANNKMILIREGRERQDQYYVVEYNKILEDNDYDPTMRPGDRVIVDASYLRHPLISTGLLLKNLIYVGIDARYRVFSPYGGIGSNR